MSMQGFERCMNEWVWLPRNDGQPLHRTSGDAGGWTAWGITLGALAGWRAKHRLPLPTPADLDRMSRDERLDFYHAEYWMPAAGDDLPVGPDLMTLDIAVMSGPGAAAKLLRQAVGLPAGWRLDAQTVSRAQTYGPADLTMTLCHAHNAYDAAIRGDAQFKGGWYARAQGAQTLALAWVQAAQAAKKAVATG